jgi:hypothetical protein
MNTFLLVLHLVLANGEQVNVPMTSWAFDSRGDCELSMPRLNQGLDTTKRAYMCVDRATIESHKVASAK